MKVEVKGLKFSSAHFVVGHPKCERLHGHDYYVDVLVEGQLDEKGMLVDFGMVKQVIKPILDMLDHKIIIPKGNTKLELHNLDDNGVDSIFIVLELDMVTYPKKLFLTKDEVCLLPIKNSTAELIGEWMYGVMKEEFLKLGDYTLHLRLYEGVGSMVEI